MYVQTYVVDTMHFSLKKTYKKHISLQTESICSDASSMQLKNEFNLCQYDDALQN